MNTKFTPGPWRWGWEYADNGGKFICVSSPEYPYDIISEYGVDGEANAHLIAAAPKLYEALEEMVLQYEGICLTYVEDGVYVERDKPILNRLRGLLAEARGEIT